MNSLPSPSPSTPSPGALPRPDEPVAAATALPAYIAGPPKPCRVLCYHPATDCFTQVTVRSDNLGDEITVAFKSKLQLNLKILDVRLLKTDLLHHPRASLRQRTLEWLHQQPQDADVSRKFICDIFPHGPHGGTERRVDIVVADLEVMEMLEALGDPFDVYKRKITKNLHQKISGLAPEPSPSVIVTSPTELKKLLGQEPQIHIDRVPAAIFSPILAKLQQTLGNLEHVQVSQDELIYASLYFKAAVRFYDSEAPLQIAIQEIVDRAIGPGAWEKRLGNLKPGATWWHENFLLLALELKNTVGLSGDATLQAVVDYIKIISQDSYKSFRDSCNFPCIIVGLTANRVEVSVAVCVGPVYVSKLLSLDLFLGFHTSENIIRLARVFKALSSCHKDLKAYYDGVGRGKVKVNKLSCLYPNVTPVDSGKAPPPLDYCNFMSRAGKPVSTVVDVGNMASALYMAVLKDNSQDVIVKFTAQYNPEAHRLLATAGLAPALHYCERVVGNLYMVVMDRAKGHSVWQLQQDNRPLPAVIAMKAKEAVDLLHSSGIVFGDLRDPNVLYDSTDGCVMLVDFDWAGKEGESVYPATLNPHNVWAPGVERYNIMLREHNLYQVERLKGLCEENLEKT